MQLTAAVEDGFHQDFMATAALTLSVLSRPFTSTDLFTCAGRQQQNVSFLSMVPRYGLVHPDPQSVQCLPWSPTCPATGIPV